VFGYTQTAYGGDQCQ